MKFLSYINPLEWIKAYSFHRKNSKYDKSSYDLELWLYANILRNDMLHYGYFEDTDVTLESISLQQFEEAQANYANMIVNHVEDLDNYVLDVGCGMGGLSELLLDKGLKVEALTPNKDQVEYIRSSKQNLSCHHCKFEDFETNSKFGTIINAESLQYISLTEAFAKIDQYLIRGGRWIVTDYFRLQDNSDKNQSGHLLRNFESTVASLGWKIEHERDITLNVMPTLAFANMYWDRFMEPIKHYAYEKLRYKKAWLYYLTRNLRDRTDIKIEKEKAAININRFISEKRYMFYVIDKR